MGVALVTGCSSGFGFLTALELARRGDTVFATMRNLDKAEFDDAAVTAVFDTNVFGPIRVARPGARRRPSTS